MGTNRHAADRAASGRTNPPPGPDRITDQDHALRAGREGPTQRKSVPRHESRTRDEGRGSTRKGSDSNRS